MLWLIKILRSILKEELDVWSKKLVKVGRERGDTGLIVIATDKQNYWTMSVMSSLDMPLLAQSTLHLDFAGIELECFKCDWDWG